MYHYVNPLRRKQDPALLLHYCFLTASPLFLCSPSSLISNCLKLPLGTQGGSGRLKPFSYNEKCGTQKGFCTWEDPYRVLLGFSPPFFFDTPQSWGEQVLGNKANNDLGREVNYKLSRGTVLWGLGLRSTQNPKFCSVTGRSGSFRASRTLYYFRDGHVLLSTFSSIINMFFSMLGSVQSSSIVRLIKGFELE